MLEAGIVEVIEMMDSAGLHQDYRAQVSREAWEHDQINAAARSAENLWTSFPARRIWVSGGKL